MFCYWYFLSVCCLQLFNVLFEEKNAVLYSFIVFQRRRGVVFRFLRGAIRCTQTSRCYARRRYIRAHSCVFIAQQISFMTGERVAASKYSFALCCAVANFFVCFFVWFYSFWLSRRSNLMKNCKQPNIDCFYYQYLSSLLPSWSKLNALFLFVE